MKPQVDFALWVDGQHTQQLAAPGFAYCGAAPVFEVPALGSGAGYWGARGSIYGRDDFTDVRSGSVMDSSGGSIIAMMYFSSGRCWMVA